MHRWYLVLGLLIASCGASAGYGDDSPTPNDAATSDAGLVDPCPEVPPSCPTAPVTLARGSGLQAIDRCAFPLAVGSPDSTASLLEALPEQLVRVSIASVLQDLNRTAVRIAPSDLPGTAPGVRRAYAWQSGDESVAYWIPQGITGSFDQGPTGVINGRQVMLVSWYYSQAADPGSTVEKGVRIAIADVTDPNNVTYRFALLVEPSGTAAVPSFRSVPFHAGGLAWVGDRLYVPITGSGFRVFDLSQILTLDGLEDKIGFDAATNKFNAYGYAYAIPQIQRYETAGVCAPRFSFVAVDQSSTPASLVTGEYDAASVAGRLYRWPLNGAGEIALTNLNRVIPIEAWFAAESHVQGAIAYQDTWWLSSSRPVAGAGELVRTREEQPSTTLGWSDSPEDLAMDIAGGSVWSVTEGLNERYLFEVNFDAVRAD